MDNKKVLNYKEVALRAGVSHSTLKKIMCGVRRASPKTAIKLEEATGIEAAAWMLPERYNLRKKYKELKVRMECGECSR